ncbi:MAG: adenylate/guanylate cyclase domain-containing protein [Rhodothermales bacterium]
MSTSTKILVVDDEPDLAVLVRQKFRKHIRDGIFSFAIASDGMEALNVLEKDADIEIVLTDINMPRMDGLTLLSKISELDRQLQAIVVSAYGDLGNIRLAMNRGSFDFLMKPIDLLDLEITINKAKETVQQQKKAARVRKTFGRYLSDEVVATLLSKPDALKLGGEKRKVSILMSDLRGFSIISEHLPPEQVVDVLNIYLGKMADIIALHNGTIDEFIGDAILVIFGGLITKEDDAARAVACALAMQNGMNEVNESLRKNGLPALEMGIGINTGEVVVGNIGSQTRAKYGVVGSHVNLTARIESYTVGGQVLISDGTRRELDGLVQLGREMKLSAKGYSNPINIYEVEGIGEPYNINLPSLNESLKQLEKPLPFSFSILDGKHMTGDLLSGKIIALSSTMALIESEQNLDELANIRIEFHTGSNEAIEITGDLYAKAVASIPQQHATKIRFTAVPEDIAEAIRQLCN